MSGWNTNKRFWENASYQATEGGLAITLDGRTLKTPAKTPVVVPTQALAEAIAQEWQAQGEQVDPMTMPVTRTANSALDKVALQKAEVADMLADYGGTDLLSYRATEPVELIERQAKTWDPILEWAATELGARLTATQGVMFHAQDEAALQALKTRVHALSNFELAAFHDLVSLSGSLVLGFAAILEYSPIETLWEYSRVDELWQEELWGFDEEAHALAETKRAAFIHAARFYKLCNK
ncbi:ATP12 family protein [Cognatishimia sp. 1_MG-2023]|uniref:ATP12 family chaperone protein n=1 Tax=Cognatishimia sp. 1_MG-2023 TaxID=3062642 RepID=UPI0026E3D948|nr:ATP12 family protein [Cognatishimia sp. 1_MG-2023]MDO6727735.1 ATP12 family protein [Cognatishimia sp. 1_MG-2023]